MLRFARTSSLIAGAATLLVLALPASAQLTVGTKTGYNGYPFLSMGSDMTPRYQQVYSASAFSGSVYIDALTFFMSDFPGNLDGNSYIISLSTTSAGVNALSLDQNANVGANSAVFFTGVLSGFGGPSYTINGTPFIYDPSAGNLLMEVMVSGNLTSDFPAVSFDADERGILMSRTYFYAGTDVYADPGALVTRFNTRPVADVVPEPASIALMATGLAGLALLRRRGRRSA